MEKKKKRKKRNSCVSFNKSKTSHESKKPTSGLHCGEQELLSSQSHAHPCCLWQVFLLLIQALPQALLLAAVLPHCLQHFGWNEHVLAATEAIMIDASISVENFISLCGTMSRNEESIIIE